VCASCLLKLGVNKGALLCLTVALLLLLPPLLLLLLLLPGDEEEAQEGCSS
jgi:hypothetical protein